MVTSSLTIYPQLKLGPQGPMYKPQGLSGQVWKLCQASQPDISRRECPSSLRDERASCSNVDFFFLKKKNCGLLCSLVAAARLLFLLFYCLHISPTFLFYLILMKQ
ncbi:hypothetical protein KFK09_009365 [Dendrobium nobile]|uniref:Uncharacterized protein n=1 Tax=Dendrobium nobile TaxID=94219 RepID=A0A8T3BJN9_DENNO|nr:hypothetical protein KFK09_009365 [Dendrobium nobile]